MTGKVVLVGAGPGDLDLLTLKGKEYLSQADCIIYDRLLNVRMLELAKDSCEKVFVGKENHNHTLSQDGINQLLFEKAKEHKLVVRLKGGDPYVFGRGGEEAIYLRDRGIDVETVPGISSSIAALAAAGIPITHRGLSKGFQVITAHSKKDELSDIDFRQLKDENITLVFLMGLAHVAEIAKGLIESGRSKDTPAAVISNGTTNHQKKVVGTLENIATLVKNQGLVSPAIIVVGKVVKLSNQLDFFERRPLFGKKIFLPKLRSFNYSLAKGIEEISINELEDRLSKNGAEVISIDTGKIIPVKCDLEFINNKSIGDFIVFTSGNGVRSFFWNLFENYGRDIRAISQFSFAVVGEKTAEILKSFGVIADLIPVKQTAADLARLIGEKVNRDANIYWLCGREQSPEFENILGTDYLLQKIVCYENQPCSIKISPEVLEEIRNCDGAIFTSGSNVKAVCNCDISLPQRIFSIGPSCTGVLQEQDLSDIYEASRSSYDGLFDLLIRELG